MDVKDRMTAEWALRERVKELTCLYGIAKVVQREEATIDEKLQGIVDLIPPAWQFPEICVARITACGREFTCGESCDGCSRQSADVLVRGVRQGEVEVYYRDETPRFDEGPFLKEERSLIDEIARQVGQLLEKREAEEQKERLEEHVRRGHRLATIGQLAAGIAHELNEPLVAILGYAELMQQTFGLPDSTARDLQRIVKASLHAREVVRNMLLFARQAPSSEKRAVDLAGIVRDSLVLLEARCREAGVKVILVSGSHAPKVHADAAHMQQVVLNLCVNAVQSMPGGGTLRISIAADGGMVKLSVEDTGEGMGEDIRRQLFDPFFTTKPIGQGTGLGLSVVHGIVTSHDGRIAVESVPGRGSRFDVFLPASDKES